MMASYTTFVCSVRLQTILFLPSFLDSYYGTKSNWSVLWVVLRLIDLTILPASAVFSSMTSKLHTVIHLFSVTDVAPLTVFDILRDQLNIVFFTIPRFTQ